MVVTELWPTALAVGHTRAGHCGTWNTSTVKISSRFMSPLLWRTYRKPLSCGQATARLKLPCALTVASMPVRTVEVSVPRLKTRIAVLPSRQVA